ncbi:MAG: AAA family ATPase [Candidatus Verstraetearchaeota archaeon]|nr:AAA family ATPase [Candidatus Verstraetearchaeota archaeon]
MRVEHRIGLAYLPGALPCFEGFGELPTDVVGGDGKVNGKPASDVLDMIIVPGGSLVESQSTLDGILDEISKMAENGKFVLGVCAGFQLLAKETDIGRLSAVPIIRKGLGLLDAKFRPLICTDRVKATVAGKSFLTEGVEGDLAGFHCHTYGRVELGEGAKRLLVSHVNRVNYRKDPQDIISGATNEAGNVAGVLVHGLLDQNPCVVKSIANSLGISDDELQGIRMENRELTRRMRSEIGISTNIHAPENAQTQPRRAMVLLVTAIASGSGKTVVVTGLAGALRRMGFRVGVMKIGGDIRDAVPALYLIKEPVREYTSLRIGESGWSPLIPAMREAEKAYDFLIVEGAMSVLTGVFNKAAQRPSSTAEVAAALGAPTILVVGCDKEGIEGALLNTLTYARVLKAAGVRAEGAILNKVSPSFMGGAIREVVERSLNDAGVRLLGMVPRADLEGRGAIPEIEIRYEEFCAKSLEIVERSIDLRSVIGLAAPFEERAVDFTAFSDKMRALITEPDMISRGAEAC